MKIGIDVSPIVYGTGVSVYTQNLVENLLTEDKENSYKLFFSSLRQKFPELPLTNYELLNYKIPPTLLDIIWNKFHVMPLEWLMKDIDVFHCSDWTQPPAKKTPTVTTIHDLSFLRWPESVHPKVLKAQRRRLKWVKKEANQIIAVSKATKKEIIDLLDIDKERISVIYEGVPKDVINFKFSDNQFSKIKSKYNLPDKYIIAFGSQAPRKNIKRLVKTFEKLDDNFSNLHLIICGRYQPDFKLPKKTIVTGFLARKELLSILTKAQALVYPSTYEGFGLPILEAFALQTPVVTSNCSSMAEVAGDGAILVEPESIKSISEGIKKVISDNNLKKEFIKKGQERLPDFSWQKTARQTLEIYNQVLQ